MLDLVLNVVARLMLAVPGHRGCCSPPSWTAYIGQRWDTFDVAPWNVYNLLWRAGQWAMARAESVEALGSRHEQTVGMGKCGMVLRRDYRGIAGR